MQFYVGLCKPLSEYFEVRRLQWPARNPTFFICRQFPTNSGNEYDIHINFFFFFLGISSCINQIQYSDTESPQKHLNTKICHSSEVFFPEQIRDSNTHHYHDIRCTVPNTSKSFTAHRTSNINLYQFINKE